MRVALVFLGLIALAGCVQPVPEKTAANQLDYKRFVEPTNGAAYSQSDMYYYRSNASTGYMGPTGTGAFRTK